MILIIISVNSTNSKTFHVVNEGGFQISYADGSETSGDYFTDSLTVSGMTLDNFTMGLGLNDSNSLLNHGIMGISFEDGEAIQGKKYPNFPEAMVNSSFVSSSSSLVSSKAYSLWLDDLEAGTGSILFGGIDTSKYTGDLVSLDIPPLVVNGSSTYQFLFVDWTSLSVSSSSGTDILTNSEFPIPAVLDSGSTDIYFPPEIWSLIQEEFGIENGLVRCSLAERSGTIDFGFGGEGGPVIKVPISELVGPGSLDPPAYDTGAALGEPFCDFLGQEAVGFLVLGDSFLRSAYVVYDLSNKKIAIAQTVFNSTAPANIVPFASLGAPIPSATALTNQVTQTVPFPVSWPTALPSGTPTLNAAAGFTSSSASPTGTKKSDAGSMVFGWSKCGWAACLAAGSVWLAF